MFFTRLRKFALQNIMEGILIALCIGFAIGSKTFLSLENAMAILYAVSMQGLIAFGMTMVIISGEIDLSVGSTAAFAGCLTVAMIDKGVSAPAAILMALIIGSLTGMLTATMRNKYQVPSFITTLALLTGLRGGAFLLTNGKNIITVLPKWFLFIGGGRVGGFDSNFVIPVMNKAVQISFPGIPFPAIIFLLGFLAVQFIMKNTTFGRSVYAVGGNAAAARLCGINVQLTRLMVLAITSMFASLSGVLLSSRIESGTPTVAVGWELDAIAAVIIGGTSFTGGVGRVWGTLIGIIFIGVLSNGMTLMNVDVNIQYVTKGLLILFAVLLNRMQERRTA